MRPGGTAHIPCLSCGSSISPHCWMNRNAKDFLRGFAVSAGWAFTTKARRREENAKDIVAWDCRSNGNPLVDAVREAVIEIRLEAQRSRFHVPGAILELSGRGCWISSGRCRGAFVYCNIATESPRPEIFLGVKSGSYTMKR